MEKKTVYCQVDECRNKKLTLHSSEHDSDVKILEAALRAISQKDAHLNTLISQSLVFFQMEDENGIFCDVEDHEDIPHNAKLKVVCAPVITDVEPEQILSLLNDTTSSNENLSENNSAVNPAVKENIEIKQVNEDIIQTKRNPIQKKITHNKIPYPAVLPKLTDELILYVKEGVMYKKQSEFVSFWAANLYNRTNGEPTKSDYANYAQTIIDTYEEFQSGESGRRIMSSQLSSCIRKRRFQMKHKGDTKETAKRRKIENADNSYDTNVPSTSNNRPSRCKTDLESAISELKKYSPLEDNTNVRRLLKETFSYRRNWIKSGNSLSIRNVIDEFPHLQTDSLVLFELFLLKDCEETVFSMAMERMFNKLATYFELNITKEYDKACVIEKLYLHLTQQKFKKMNESLITVVEAGKSVKELLTADTCAPRLVMYHMEGSIAAAFVVAGGGVKIKIVDPTVAKSVSTLVAAYYAWEIVYPAAYQRTLTFIDHEVLKTPITSKNGIDKFLRDITHKLKSESNK